MEANLTEQLSKLSKMHADGVLNDEEFKALKAKLDPPRSNNDRNDEAVTINQRTIPAVGEAPTKTAPNTLIIGAGIILVIIVGVIIGVNDVKMKTPDITQVPEQAPIYAQFNSLYSQYLSISNGQNLTSVQKQISEKDIGGKIDQLEKRMANSLVTNWMCTTTDVREDNRNFVSEKFFRAFPFKWVLKCRYNTSDLVLLITSDLGGMATTLKPGDPVHFDGNVIDLAYVDREVVSDHRPFVHLTCITAQQGPQCFYVHGIR